MQIKNNNYFMPNRITYQFAIEMFSELQNYIRQSNIANHIKNYYSSLFQEIQTSQFLNAELTEDQVETIYRNFDSSVRDNRSMVQYLNRTPDMYGKLCLWAIKNPCPIDNEVFFPEKHHIGPKHMKENGVSNEIIEQPCNLITVDLLFHFLLHFIRLVEYKTLNDQRAATFVISKINGPYLTKKLKMVGLYGLYSFTACLWNQQISTKKNVFASPHFYNEAGFKMTSAFKEEIINGSSTWVHVRYKEKNNTPLTLNFKAAPRTCNDFIRQMLVALPKKDSKRINYLQPENPFAIKKAARVFTMYFDGEKDCNSFCGFVLQNQDPTGRILTRAVSGQPRTKHETGVLRNRTNQKTLELLDNWTFTLQHDDSHIPDILVTPGKFSVLKDLVRHAFDVYNQNCLSNQPLQKTGTAQLDELARFITAKTIGNEAKTRKVRLRCYKWQVIVIKSG